MYQISNHNYFFIVTASYQRKLNNFRLHNTCHTNTMQQQLPQIYITVVIATFLCSLISFRLHYPFHLRLFSILLEFTALTEILANFFLSRLHLASNYPVYNIFILVQYPLLAYYFGHILTSKSLRRITNVFIALYPVFWVSIFLFVYSLNDWCTYGAMAGDFFIIIFSVRYLYELFSGDRLVSFKKHSEFWIAVALVFYSCCKLPITGILNYLVQDWQHHNRETTLELIAFLQVLNIIMYSLFIYAFLCRANFMDKK